MVTEIDSAVPQSVVVVSPNKAVLTFDLRAEENISLADKDALSQYMGLIMLKYAGFDSYRAEYLGDLLVLTCRGNINYRYGTR